MPKFIIPAGIKLQNKADMALIQSLGDIIDAGPKGMFQSTHDRRHWDRGYGLGILKAFRLVEQKTRILKARPGFQKALKSIPKLTKALAAAKPTDIKAFDEASGALRKAIGDIRDFRPIEEYYYVATAKGKKLYDDIQIILSGDEDKDKY